MQTTKGEIMMGLIFPIEKITLKELKKWKSLRKMKLWNIKNYSTN